MVEVHTRSAPSRAAHPALPQLLGNLELSAASLNRRPSETALPKLAQMMANAEYWLSFELASFEPLLAKSPSPLRELGVAVALRFGEDVFGELGAADLTRAREVLEGELGSTELWPGVSGGLEILARAVAARDGQPALEAAGYKIYAPTAGLSVHALRAMGRAQIHVEDVSDREARVHLEVGRPVLLTSSDERGRPLVAPDIESRLGAPLLTKDEAEGQRRTAIFLVPGEYLLRVPGRAAGDRKIVAG